MGGGAAGGLWRHQQWSPSWILPRIRNQVKTATNNDFWSFTWTLHDFRLKIHFYCWKKLKEHVFSPKNGLTTCGLSRYHSNWPSLNLSQKVRERWTNRFWKRQVLMFFLRPRVKMNLRFFKLWCVYSSSLKKSNEGGFSCSWLSSWWVHTRLVTV